MKKYTLYILLFISNLSFAAYTMDGVMDDNSNGTYTINVVSNSGHSYLGMGEMQGDGSLTVNLAIQGGGVEIYLGTATPNQDGTYTLHLKNNATDQPATGTLEVH